jgi:hypothetical protein
MKCCNNLILTATNEIRTMSNNEKLMLPAAYCPKIIIHAEVQVC